MQTRRVVFHFHSANTNELKEEPGLELYCLTDRPNVESAIEHALLNDLHAPILLAFVGNVQAKLLAELYRGSFFPDEPGIAEEVKRWFRLQERRTQLAWAPGDLEITPPE